MAIPSRKNRIGVPKWVGAVAVTLFAVMWLSLMTAGLSSGGCTQRPLTDPKKLAYCNISILAGALFDLFPSERAKRAPLHLERGIVQAASGDLESAKDDFRKALLHAAGTQKNAGLKFPQDLELPRVAHLFAIMNAEPTHSVAMTPWLEVVGELFCGSSTIDPPEFCAAP